MKKLSKYQSYDYLTPIIADAGSGFGETTTIMKLTKLFVEVGTAGIHISDLANSLT